MIYSILIVLHLIVSILLVVVILLQSSKGGGLAGSAFGGGGGGSSFLGARGTANFLTRATTILAVVFMLNSLGLSFLLRGSGSVVSVTQQDIQSAAENLPRLPGGVDMSGTQSAPLQSLPNDQAGDQGSSATEQPAESGGSTEQ